MVRYNVSKQYVVLSRSFKYLLKDDQHQLECTKDNNEMMVYMYGYSSNIKLMQEID